MFSKRARRNVVIAATVALLGCEESELVASRGLGGTGTTPAAGTSNQGDAAQGDTAGVPSATASRFVYADEDFVELETQNRDPFRPFARAFKAQAAAPAQRRVLMPSTSLDEMKLIAIVSGVSQPKAMLTDTAQVGHVIRRGDYVGRPEVVQSGGSEGMPVTLNWRVDRIRAGSVVLTREDPTAPDKPPLTRIMPLYEGREPG